MRARKRQFVNLFLPTAKVAMAQPEKLWDVNRIVVLVGLAWLCLSRDEYHIIAVDDQFG